MNYTSAQAFEVMYDFMRTCNDDTRRATNYLTKCGSRVLANDLQWWQRPPRVENNINIQRRQTALRFYVNLAGFSDISLPTNSFPAIFDFSDNVSFRSDKGIIKALLNAHLNCIRGEFLIEDLIFIVN